ncbi:MAG TPA: polysaccharide biosynthesis/export family protein [Gemmataceae bacterium]|nr:polysaccharide biosynthesis/export family protein [Gemmataceae bacterium]
MRRTRYAAVAVLGAALLGGAGCVGTGPGHYQGEGPPLIAVPPPGAVPRELDKVTLPPYVMEAPDALMIEVVIRSPDKDKDGKPTGETSIKPLPVQPISSSGGPFNIRADGTVLLGIWGSVQVSGLSLEQAADAIRQHLLRSEILREYKTAPENLFVIMDVLAYNSKRYYVISDNAGNGEQGAAFPITGSETVLDAIMNIGGLGPVASKRNIWVARRTPHAGQHWQILPVDWVGITQHGVTATNYQIMPGDRIYVKAQRLVTIDRTLARIFAPVERVFGITLLGSSTVNNLKGNVGGNNTGN